VLSAEEACDIALEYGFNPVVDDEAAFDIFPEYVMSFLSGKLLTNSVVVLYHLLGPISLYDHLCEYTSVCSRQRLTHLLFRVTIMVSENSVPYYA